jgi:hypothetical protein
MGIGMECAVELSTRSQGKEAFLTNIGSHVQSGIFVSRALRLSIFLVIWL